MNHSNGTFVAVRFDEETVVKLFTFGMMNMVPNMINARDFHSTIVYSRKPLLNVPRQRDISPSWIAKPIGFDIFDTRASADGIVTKCLVLKLESADMLGRHNFLRRWEGASHGFPSYNPHITLSYDIGDYDISKLKAIDTLLPQIVIVQEYCEELKDVERRKEDRKEKS